MDTDALPRRKDASTWKLIGNRGIEVKETEREREMSVSTSEFLFRGDMRNA